MRKPSPYQARLLRFMVEEDYHLEIGHWSYQGEPRNVKLYPINTPTNPANLDRIKMGHSFRPRPTARTLKSLHSKGLVYYQKDDRYKKYRPRKAFPVEGVGDLLQDLEEEDFVSPERPAPAMTHAQVVDRLAARHPLPEWVFIREFSPNTGFVRNLIDAFAMHCWPSQSWRRVAYEVKVSRSDYLREVADPDKRERALQIANYFYFVTLPEVAQPAEMPKGCGLMHCHPSGHLEVVREATRRETSGPTWGLLASALRNVLQGNGDGPASEAPE